MKTVNYFGIDLEINDNHNWIATDVVKCDDGETYYEIFSYKDKPKLERGAVNNYIIFTSQYSNDKAYELILVKNDIAYNPFNSSVEIK